MKREPVQRQLCGQCPQRPSAPQAPSATSQTPRIPVCSLINESEGEGEEREKIMERGLVDRRDAYRCKLFLSNFEEGGVTLGFLQQLLNSLLVSVIVVNIMYEMMKM